MKNVYECIHIEDKKETIYRFVGDKDKNKECVNDKAIVVDNYIFNDDTILDIHQKIKKYILKNRNVKSIYCWCESIILYEDKYIRDFVDECFFDKFEISKSYLELCILNKFGKNVNINVYEMSIDKEEVFKILKFFKLKFHYEPLTNAYLKQDTKYLYNYQINPINDNDSDDNTDNTDVIGNSNDEYDVKSINHKTIESFVPRNKRIYFIDDSYTFKSTNLKKLYFPIGGDKLINNLDSKKYKQLNSIFENIENSKNKKQNKLKDVLSYAIFRLNEKTHGDTSILNLGNVFKYFIPSEQFPFIKHVTKSNVFFRLLKNTDIKKEVIKKWTKVNKNRSVNNDYIIIKIDIDGKYHNLFLLPSGMIDIQCLFGVSKSYTTQYISNVLFPVFNECIKLIYGDSKTLTNAVFNNAGGVSYSYINKYSIVGSIKSPKTLPVKSLAFIIEKELFHHFNVSQIYADKIELVYKRSETFSTEYNILLFIKKNNSKIKKKYEMIEKIASYFSIDEETAKEYYEKLKDNNLFYKHYLQSLHENLIVIISPSINGYNFIISGLTNKIFKKRIYNLLTYIINYDVKKIKTVNKKVTPVQNTPMIIKEEDFEEENVDNFEEENMDQIEYSFEQNEEALADYLKTLQENLDFDDDEEINDIKEIVDLVDEVDDEVEDEIITENHKADKNIYNKFILTSLLDADLNLFKPVGIPQGKYAKTCQMTIKRQPRQPVVVSNAELEKIKKENGDSINNSLSMGSTLTLKTKNNYICPQVWCPKSRMALSKETFEKNGKKCPNPEDYPIVYYESDYFKNGKGYVRSMKLKDKNSTKEFSVPCCYANNKKENNTVDNDNDNEIDSQNPENPDNTTKKYILKESNIPLEKSRYGLIPAKLSFLLGNDNTKLGDRHDGTGNMDSDMNATLRYGINNTSIQSFLECMVYVLDNKKIADVDKLIDMFATNIDIQDFIVLSNGTVCRNFIGEGNNIENPEQYSNFRKWFISGNRDEYIKKFGTKDVYNFLLLNDTYKKNDQHVVREFMFYNSYINFIKYLKNKDIVKSHNLLFDIFNENKKWLNTKEYNFILFEYVDEEILLYCNKYKDQNKAFNKDKPYVIILKQGVYYEPVVHVNIVDGNLNMTYIYERRLSKDQNNVFKIIDFFTKNCKSVVNNDNKIASSIISRFDNIKSFILDYNLRCCGILLDTLLYIPFEKPSYIISEINIKNRDAKFQFIDDMYDTIKPDLKKEYVDKILDMIGIKYNKNFKNFIVTSYNETILLKKLDSDDKPESYDRALSDLHIFTKWRIKDERVNFIDQYNAVESMKSSVFKELHYAVVRDKKIKQFINHIKLDNTLTQQQKKKLLYNQIKDIIPGFMVVSNSRAIYKGEHLDKPCTKIGKKQSCVAQCAMVGDKKGLLCKLKAPKNIFDMLITLAIDKILDVNYNINGIIYNNKKNIENYETSEKYITFSDSDLIDDTFVDNISGSENNAEELEIVEFNTNAFIETKADTTENSNFLDLIITDDLKKVPTEYRVSFKTFVVFSSENYNKDLFYKIFTNIYVNARNKEIDVVTLEELVINTILKFINKKEGDIFQLLKMIPEFEEFDDLENKSIEKKILTDLNPRVVHLYALSKILKAHILVFGRVKKPHYTQNFRCVYPLLENEDNRNKFIIMYQSNLGDGEDKFEVVGKKIGKGKMDYKYIFNDSDFSEIAFSEIKKRCTLHIK